MNTYGSFEGMPGPLGAQKALARWLQDLLRIQPQYIPPEQLPIGEEVSLLGEDYHLPFYPQIPDFAMAILKNDSTAATRYAPLLFHLIGCTGCRQAYAEIYDGLRAAIDPEETQPLAQNFQTTKVASVPVKMQIFLCQLLIGQARAVLRQARRDHTDQEAWARSLLQQAIQVSKHITQSMMRQRALRDLIEVATLYNASSGVSEVGPPTHSYASLVGGAPGARGKTMRRAEMLQRPAGQPVIHLQSGTLEGFITQVDEMLELHLEGLNEQLRGHRVFISIPLGSLFEPVRWLGGNPAAIRSSLPVGQDGKLIMGLGKTELLMSNAEERNLLETLFKKLDVHPAD